MRWLLSKHRDAPEGVQEQRHALPRNHHSRASAALEAAATPTGTSRPLLEAIARGRAVPTPPPHRRGSEYYLGDPSLHVLEFALAFFGVDGGLGRGQARYRNPVRRA